jgi:hypothetical protein
LKVGVRLMVGVGEIVAVSVRVGVALTVAEAVDVAVKEAVGGCVADGGTGVELASMVGGIGDGEQAVSRIRMRIGRKDFILKIITLGINRRARSSLHIPRPCPTFRMLRPEKQGSQ